MATLVHWDTIGTIFVQSLAAGVVIVGAFALGARLVGSGQTEDGQVSRPSPLIYVLAALCFAVAAIAIAYGIYFTVDK